MTYLAELVGDRPRGSGSGRPIPARSGRTIPSACRGRGPAAWTRRSHGRTGASRELGPPAHGSGGAGQVVEPVVLLRLPTGTAAAWSKSVPPFMGHEGAILAHGRRDLPGPRPAAAGVRSRDADGAPRRGPGRGPVRREAPAAARDGRSTRGAPGGLRRSDRRALGGGVAGLARPGVRPRGHRAHRPRRRPLGARPGHPPCTRRLVADLPRRLADLEACGLPETLVHGDFHPGNWRSGTDLPVLVDWGDSGVGHPLFDMPAFLTRIPAGDVEVSGTRGSMPGAPRGRTPTPAGPPS